MDCVLPQPLQVFVAIAILLHQRTPEGEEKVLGTFSTQQSREKVLEAEKGS